MKKIGEVELRGGPDEMNRDEEDTGTGDDRRRIVVSLSEDIVKRKKGEPKEVKDRQERILEKRLEEQWESIRGRALAAEDRRENSWRVRRRKVGRLKEVVCRMNGGGQKKNKINQQCERNTVISEERTSDEWTGSEEENKTEDWEKVIEDGLKE